MVFRLCLLKDINNEYGERFEFTYEYKQYKILINHIAFKYISKIH